MKDYFTLFIVLFACWGCEKRILLDTPFPHQKNQIFCEVIGFVDRGFFGTVSQVQKVENALAHEAVEITIREEDIIIYHDMLQTPSLNFPYSVKDELNYSIEIHFDDQTINSPTVKNKSAFLTINQLAVEQTFIDSLGFKVATVSFNFLPPTNINLDTDLFFAYSTELKPDFSTTIQFDDTSQADSLSLNSSTFIEKRLPNFSNYTIAQVGLLSMDASLFQYLKNIKQLGIIPNDNIEGHHGNLQGGIGYFGIVNYDFKQLVF